MRSVAESSYCKLAIWAKFLRLESTLTFAPLIVIVEDDESLLHALVQLLRSFGYHAEGYESPGLMLEATKDRTVHVVATDVQMPGMDGFELSRRLRERSPELPIIMLTASGDAGLDDRAADAGALCLLKKPLGAGQLVTWIEAALAGPPAEE